MREMCTKKIRTLSQSGLGKIAFNNSLVKMTVSAGILLMDEHTKQWDS